MKLSDDPRRIVSWIDDQTGQVYLLEDMTKEQLIRALQQSGIDHAQTRAHLERVLNR